MRATAQAAFGKTVSQGDRKYYLLNLDASASLKALVNLARC
jgi:hypothetical protein